MKQTDAIKVMLVKRNMMNGVRSYSLVSLPSLLLPEVFSFWECEPDSNKYSQTIIGK